MKTDNKISIKESVTIALRLVVLVWRNNKFLFTINVFSSVLPTFLSFVNLYIYKFLIDAVAQAITTHHIDLSHIYWLIAARISSLLINQLANSIFSLTEDLIWIKTPNKLELTYISHIATLNKEILDDSDFKNQMEKAANSISYRPQNVTAYLVGILQSSIGLLGNLFIVAQANKLLVIIAVLATLPGLIKQAKFARITYMLWDWNSPMRKRAMYLRNVFLYFGMIEELKLYKLTNKFLKDLQELWNNFYIDQKRVAKKGFIADTGVTIFQGIVFGLIEGYFILQAVFQKVTLGDISLYTGAMNNFNSRLSEFFRRLLLVYENSLYIKSLFTVLDTKPTISNILDPQKIISDAPPKIEFNDVSFSYPKSDKKVLKNFSLKINPGEKIAFVGENGAGKTTIINLLARIYDPTSGEILIDNHPLKEIDLTNWREKLGILFQGYSRFDYTLKENIIFGDIDKSGQNETIISAAKAASVQEVADSLEKGYDQMLGTTFEDGVELSGGQWQRVSLARAFFKNAPVIVLDEPAAALDPKAEAEIFDKVQKLSKNKTVIIISHRFSTVRHADIIYVLDKGKIVESGDHKSLMKKKGKYAELFTLQAKGYQE